MTYTGHMVKHTLLRARFSPLATTGQVYALATCCIFKDTCSFMIGFILCRNTSIQRVQEDELLVSFFIRLHVCLSVRVVVQCQRMR